MDRPDTGPALRPMQPTEIDDCLRSIEHSPIFSGVAPADRGRIVPFLKTASVAAGSDVIREGEHGNGLHILMRGRCAIVQKDDRGAEKNLATLAPGDCFGEMSLLTGDPASATVRAAEDASFLVVTREEFPRLTEALPWVGLTLARLIAQRLARTSAHVVDELKKGLFGRLELVPPSALVQAVNVNSQSGLLTVESGAGSFTAYFQDGQIWEASTEKLKGADAFYEFLSWTSGTFRFDPHRREDAARAIGDDTVGLLLEGMRRVDESRRTAAPEAEKLPTLTKETVRRVAARMEPFTLADVESAMRALGRLSLFAGLEPDQIRTAIGTMHERQAPAGRPIIRQGQEGEALYVVASGSFDVIRTSAEGNEERIATLGPGDCFGEMSLITGERASATVVPRREGVLLAIPREDLYRLLGRIPILGASLARILASRLAKASRWLKEQQDVFIGRLESIPAAELVQAINVNRQSGKLAVQNESRTLEVDFADGEVMDARVDPLHGDEAFFVLLGWNRGSFRFSPGQPEHPDRKVTSDTMGLLFNGLRRIEQEHEQRQADVLALNPLAPDDIRSALDALARSPVFYRLTAEDRNRILPHLRTASVEAGREVQSQGRPGPGLFVVMSGTFEVLKRGEGDELRGVGTLGPGSCLGEMSLLVAEPSDATIRCTGAGRLLAIPREDFPALAKGLPWLGITLARLLAERLTIASAEVLGNRGTRAAGRIETLSPMALVQAIYVKGATGVLTIDSPSGSFGGYFQEGQLFAAVAGELRNVEALRAAAAWPSGTYRFESRRRENAVSQVKIDTVTLIDEAMRSGGSAAPPAPAIAFPPMIDMAELKSAQAALSRMALFSGVGEDRMMEALSAMIERRCAAGEVVIRQGQAGPALHVIASGQFEVARADAAGGSGLAARLAKGACFGEAELAGGTASEVTVTARTEGNLLVFPREELPALVGRIPRMAATMARILAARLTKTRRWLAERAQSGVSGTLESMAAVELVQALLLGGQSGTLVLQRDERVIEAYFREGEIQDARFGELSGDDAVFQLIVWGAGTFRFEPGRPDVPRRVTSDTRGLLFLGLRRLERACIRVAEETRTRRRQLAEETSRRTRAGS